MWVRRWHCKSEERGNRASQNSQENGRSPVCRRIWTVKFDEFEKLRPQYEHKCLLTTSRSSIGTWTRICDLKLNYIIRFSPEQFISIKRKRPISLTSDYPFDWNVFCKCRRWISSDVANGWLYVLLTVPCDKMIWHIVRICVAAPLYSEYSPCTLNRLGDKWPRASRDLISMWNDCCTLNKPRFYFYFRIAVANVWLKWKEDVNRDVNEH